MKNKVKNNFYLALIFCVFFSFAKAENNVHGLVFAGFNSSKTFTELDSKKKIISEAKLNYNFGIGFRIELGALFLQPEVYLTRKGGLENTFRTNDSNSFEQYVNMNSIDVPLMVGLQLFHDKSVSARVYGGPVLSFLQNRDSGINKNGESIPWSDIKSNTKTFSMQIGVGLDITRLFTLDVRYEYAFSPMFKMSDFKTSYRILYVTAGLKIF